MKPILILSFCWMTTGAWAQHPAEAPHLSGTINLDIRRGLVTCHLTMTGTTPQASRIILHRGFNIKYFRKGSELLRARETASETTVAYELFYRDDTLPIKSLDSVQVAYAGAFPVFGNDDSTDSDDMGVIAIKNHILRATVQSAFVPALLDPASKKETSSWTIDVQVNCSEPETVYLNGCPPQRGKQLRFKNNTALDFIIYAGDFRFRQQGNIVLLNSRLDNRQIATLAAITNRISDYYATVINIPYDSKIYFAQLFSIGPKNQYTEWAFTVTPTIVMHLDKFGSKINLSSGKIADVNVFTIIAHEMAHKYFMQMLNASGTRNLWRFYHESLAQFLAYKAVQEMYGNQAYQEKLQQGLTSEYRSRKFAPLLEIERTEKPLVNASYFYYPLVLAGFEKMFGEEKTFRLLRALVNDRDEFKGDMHYFISCLRKTGIKAEELETFKRKFLLSENFLGELK